MAVRIGDIINDRYKVEDTLGRGGMADVYKVWDKSRSTNLALKLMREDLAQDVIFMRRFRREARNLAQLQHPNIVRFYGIEEQDLQVFILMEYIEGPTLREEIRRAGPTGLPMERVVSVLEDISSALNYAHQRGLVHCDIKSGNILVDKTGKAFLTDFGIARGVEAATSTMVGIGTPAYMAPELIRGEDPTPQADIYALGILLYEMVTGGERPFTGERATQTGTTAEKVRWEHLMLEPISVRKFNPELPIEIEQIIDHTLAKNPSERISFLNLLIQISNLKTEYKINCHTGESRQDFIEDLKKINGGGKTEEIILTGSSNPLSRKEDPVPDQNKQIYKIGKTLAIITVAISFLCGGAYLIGNLGAKFEFFHRDSGKSINDSELNLISDTTPTPNNSSVDYPDFPATATALSVEKNNNQELKASNFDSNLTTPIVEDNCLILFTSDGDIFTQDLEGKVIQQLTDGLDAVNPEWSPDGRFIAFSSEGNIYIMNADGSKINYVTEGSNPTWSPDGTQIAFNVDRKIFVYSLSSGDLKRLTEEDKSGYEPNWSNDGIKIAFSTYQAGQNIFIMNTSGGSVKRVTNLTDSWGNSGPVWAPNNIHIAFETTVYSANHIYIIDLEGNGLRRLTYNHGDVYNPSWSPLGEWIAFDSGEKIFIIQKNGENAVELQAGGREPDWSPNCIDW